MQPGFIAGFLVLLVLAVGSFWYSRDEPAYAAQGEAQKQAAAFASDLFKPDAQAAPQPPTQTAAAATPQQTTITSNDKQQEASRSNGQLRDMILQNHMHATLRTTEGDITIELMQADAPHTVANFVKLAKEGFYDGTKFHRVIKGFMIQGGDPLTKDDTAMARWGTGGPGYQFADEIKASNRNDTYTISMANSGPNTNGSQFFINVGANNFLDTKHTVFGKVVSGMDVVKIIENVKTEEADQPVEAVVIESVTLN